MNVVSLCQGRRALVVVAMLGLSVMAGGVGAAPAVTAGCNAAATPRGFVQFQAFNNTSNNQVVIGTSGSTTTGAVNWGANSGTRTKAIEFRYDGAGILTSRVGTGASQVTTSRNVGSLGALNYLEIDVTKSGAALGLALNDVVLGALPVGSVAGNGTTCWTVSGVDLGAGFTLTGSIALTGAFGGGAGSNVHVDVGYVAPVVTDADGPVTSDVMVSPDPVLLNGTATVTAMIDDSTTGNSDIASAEYSLNAGDWTPMAAIDGAFEAVAEGVEASFAATEIGGNIVCVRGTDSAGNLGTALCQTFRVDYRFEGFDSPIDNDALNTAKAGQSIPAKWRVTDANGVPVSSAASFAGLYSFAEVCGGIQVAEAVGEDAAGNSGLQYNGDGYWQYNWKTSRDYANTCRSMYVLFDSGQMSPVVKFQFRK